MLSGVAQAMGAGASRPRRGRVAMGQPARGWMIGLIDAPGGPDAGLIRGDRVPSRSQPLSGGDPGPWTLSGGRPNKGPMAGAGRP